MCVFVLMVCAQNLMLSVSFLIVVVSVVFCGLLRMHLSVFNNNEYNNSKQMLKRLKISILRTVSNNIVCTLVCNSLQTGNYNCCDSMDRCVKCVCVVGLTYSMSDQSAAVV